MTLSHNIQPSVLSQFLPSRSLSSTITRSISRGHRFTPSLAELMNHSLIRSSPTICRALSSDLDSILGRRLSLYSIFKIAGRGTEGYTCDETRG